MVSKTEWKEKIADYQQSDMSQTRWCKAQGISICTFRYQLKRSKLKQQPKFIELKPLPQGIKLRWKEVTLELEPDFDEKTLQRFLNALR